MQFQSGIGNLGTHSVIDVHRVAAEMLDVPWEQCDVVLGDTGEAPAVDAASRPAARRSHAMTRAAHAVGNRREEEAAGDRGEDARRQSRPATRSPNGRVSGGGRSMTFAQAAQKAIELGGKYDGHELPEGHQRLHEALGRAASPARA